ncbi:MAG: phosphohistidine phosphatase SixA [Verrucomicrobia bacterium]|jgi:phosphohistidine phosphatase|nr:phosphohistidine phosphatase SixA [Verrucomicrobiota bacterium]MDA1203030.1 phosphohistidine phosphatase SixA [Verrucomicrobiota bacterium]
MLIYLLRHAEAEVLAASDDARRLTPKGDEQAWRVGQFCQRQGIKPPVILSSPVTRAWQTANLVAKSLSEAEVVKVPWAECGMDPWAAMDELKAYAKFPSVMLVGHQPDLGGLAAALLGMQSVQSVRVRKALLMGIDASGGLATGAGTLQFFVPVRLM